MTDKLNVSLEPHLRDALTGLLPIMPEFEARQQLTLYLSSTASATATPLIPYEFVLQVSRWCQTTDGKAALQACSSPLHPQSYTMTSLLAGTRTSPEKHFSPYAAKDPEEEERLRAKDRKAIATLVNAVISVIGTGVGTWWASEHAGMRLEWRALTAVCAALVIAFTELVLYMIWDSRQQSKSQQPTRKIVMVPRKDTTEGASDSAVVSAALTTAMGSANLRHRTTTLTTE